MNINIRNKKYNHIWIAILYLPIYLTWWNYLQNKTYENIYILNSKIDSLIPFNEYFVVPYIIWFFYISFVFLLLFFYDKKNYYKFCLYSFTGLTICLIIFTIFPMTHNMRPEYFENNNIFTRATIFLYRNDKPLNLLPSIHCYNSIVAFVIITKSEVFNKNKLVVLLSFILTISICVSTVTIKQHSFYDFVAAVILAIVLYVPIFSKKSSIIFNFFI